MKLKDTPAVKNMAKKLGLTRVSNAEEAIREYCVRKVEKIIEPLGRPNDLNQLLAIVSSSLRLKFEEVDTDSDLWKLSQKYLGRGEIIFGDLHQQLDEETDAIVISLSHETVLGTQVCGSDRLPRSQSMEGLLFKVA